MLVGIFVGVIFIFSLFDINQKRYNINIQHFNNTQALPEYGNTPTNVNSDFLYQTKDSLISQKADFLSVDLSKMIIDLYRDGEIHLSLPIQSKGRPGSWWETPAGLYKVELKKTNHFSSIGKVYQPWSIQFQGNFFIHGWPYYENGTETSSQFTGGCIKLLTKDAEILYKQISLGLPILVFNDDHVDDAFDYLPALPKISGESYLIGDLKNNFIFTSQNHTKSVPIASITKLMTALVASEYINLGKNISVPSSALVNTSKPRLKNVNSIEAFELLHLLLEESSNEAAEVLASHLGRENFINLMNNKSKSIGLLNTTFVDPSGIGAGNVSTPEDLFLLAKYIYNNRSFIFKISAGDLNTGINQTLLFSPLSNFNEFVDYEDFVGGKVGETIASKQTILSVFYLDYKKETKRPIVFISLGSEDSREDILKLRTYILDYFK